MAKNTDKEEHWVVQLRAGQGGPEQLGPRAGPELGKASSCIFIFELFCKRRCPVTGVPKGRPPADRGWKLGFSGGKVACHLQGGHLPRSTAPWGIHCPGPPAQKPRVRVESTIL